MLHWADPHMPVSPVTSTIDFNRDGVAHGFLKLPHSRDDSAWGAVMIPITVVKRGEGPTALLTGGNHGDEYEGPIALMNLACTLQPQEVTGRVIIVPAMNHPAFRVGTRTSPIDKGNLNRTFPGRPDGTVTQKIADYFQRALLPLADIVLDFHSGGKTLDFLPFAAVHVLPDEEQQARCEAAMEAFSAPFSMTMVEIDAVGMFDSAAEAMGKVFVTTELCGGGTASAKSVAIAARGVRNVLKHSGILEGEIERRPSVKLDMTGDDCFLTCEDEGLLEMCVDLGDAVENGQIIAQVHSTYRTGQQPVIYRAKRDGLLAARHFPGLVKPGDTVAVVATRV